MKNLYENSIVKKVKFENLLTKQKLNSNLNDKNAIF